MLILHLQPLKSYEKLRDMHKMFPRAVEDFLSQYAQAMENTDEEIDVSFLPQPIIARIITEVHQFGGKPMKLVGPGIEERKVLKDWMEELGHLKIYEEPLDLETGLEVWKSLNGIN